MSTQLPWKRHAKKHPFSDSRFLVKITGMLLLIATILVVGMFFVAPMERYWWQYDSAAYL